MKTKILSIIFFYVCLATCGPVLAYTSPGEPSGFVNDFAGVLSKSVKAELEKQLTEFEQRQSNEIAVVTVSSLDGDYIENYANQLFSDWGIGKQESDNGVLLLVAMQERQVRIEVGYGLEGALTDYESKMIIQSVITPAFKSGDFNAGILKGVQAIMRATEGEYFAPSTSVVSWPYKLMMFGFVFLPFLYFLMVMLSGSKAIWPGGLLGGMAGFWTSLLVGAGLWLVIYIPAGVALGLILDYFLSRHPLLENFRKKIKKRTVSGRGGFWGGSGRSSGGSGFGGFSGGSSGGGGASGSW